MKHIYLVLLFLLSGCAPHFYKAESVILSAQGLNVIESKNLSKDCVSETAIPKTYTIDRENYKLSFEVKGRQVGFRIISDNPNISVSADSMKFNNPQITGISNEYSNYLPIFKDGIISFVISDGEKVIANESINANIVTCKAVTIDAV